MTREEHLKRLEEFRKWAAEEELDENIEEYSDYSGSIYLKNGSYYMISDHTFNTDPYCTSVHESAVRVEAINTAMRLARRGQI